MRHALAFIIATPALVFSEVKPLDSLPPARLLPAVSAEEELTTIQLPDGYRLELVLSESDITEPTAMAFDGNGRMYVVEMRIGVCDHQECRGEGDRRTAH